MIRSLVLHNFRRHSHTEMRFDEHGQIILISGNNGSGKTSILEAIQFALYGESRYGKRNLDTLTRRGAELEGMQVELVFELGNDTYRIQRRRDGRSVTAVLWGNDIPLTEGPNAVTEAVIRLLGMDSTAFRLAVIAQQKEIDGLASLRPAERAAAIRRLLRLDALGAAKEEASRVFREQRQLVSAVRPGSSADALARELDDARAAQEAAWAEQQQAAEEIERIDALLHADAQIDAAWQVASTGRDRARQRVERESADLEGLIAEISAILIPDEPDATRSPATVAEELSTVEQQLARADAAKRIAEQRALVAEELSRSRARLAELGTADRAVLNAGVVAAEAALADVLGSASLAESELEAAKERWHRAQARIDELEARTRRARDLGSDCETCGQTIDDSHRAGLVNALERDLVAARAEAETLRDTGRTLARGRDDARTAVDSARTQLLAARELVAADERRLSERTECERRIATYSDQLERLVPEFIDAAGLHARRNALNTELAETRRAGSTREERRVALARRGELERARDGAEQRLREAREDLSAAVVSDDLQNAHERREALRERRTIEVDLERRYAKDAAEATGRVAAATSALQRRDADARRAAAHEGRAVDAANAAMLLGDASERLATRVRPMLEQALGQMLEQMSDGRFTSVRIDDDYQVVVADDGAFRPLTELSGGESDLVALAMRLALAQVVADRAGTGPGFLILDECFASQDAARRASVLGALRNLRDQYRQIFLISHVENIEDSADVVVEVEVSEDRSETTVTVS